MLDASLSSEPSDASVLLHVRHLSTAAAGHHGCSAMAIVWPIINLLAITRYGSMSAVSTATSSRSCGRPAASFEVTSAQDPKSLPGSSGGTVGSTVTQQ